MSVDHSKSYKPSNRSQMEEMSTLLEKAMTFRNQNSDSWEAREKERESTFLETIGVYKEDFFLADYYKKQDEKVEKKRTLEAKKKLEPPKLYIKLQYNYMINDDAIRSISNSLGDSYRRESLKYGSDTSDSDGGKLRFSPTDTGIFNLAPARRLSKSLSSEMTIRIVKAKYLLNWLDKFERNYDSCKIKCVLHPRRKKNSKKLKSKECHINLKGSSKIDHVFKLQGFSAEELHYRYVELEVYGKNNQRKDLIGTIVLAGNKCTISDSNSNSRGPVENENQPWQVAIENPGAGVSVAVAMKKPNEEFFVGKTTTTLNRTQLLQAKSQSPRFGQRWNSRSPVRNVKMMTM